jgi:undecaprenyl-diphosphatase
MITMQNTRTRLRRWLVYSGSALASLFITLAAVVFIVIQQGNFHTITPNEAYRSARLDANDLASRLERYHIKSVLNLLGKQPDARWYQEELAVCKKYGVAHYSVSLSASLEPTEEQIRQIMRIFAAAPRPILIYCQQGADRSGLVAAMWRVAVDKEPKSQAEKELSILYGHVPIGSTVAMDRFFEKWSP